MKQLIFTLIILGTVVASGQQTTTYKVKTNKELSSKYYDFAPRFIDGNCQAMILSSSRNDPKDTTDNPYFSIFYTTQRKNGKWKTPVAFDTSSKKSSNAIISVDQKRKVLFLTKCPLTKDKKVGCDIYYSFMQGALIGETMTLNIERPEVEGKMLMGQPFFSNELDILFFVAVDWPGGYGGNDIWFSKYDRVTDTWSKPQNMGAEINTAKDEQYPSIHPDGTFYFTSDGRGGQGGWDIFKAKKISEASWGKVENMGTPINSEGDDFGIIFKGSTNTGYFSSTRKGGLGKDDIYEFSPTETTDLIVDTTQTDNQSIQALTTIFNREECTANKESLKISEYKVFPNPNSGQFSLAFECNTKTDLTIRIFSNTGLLILTESISATKGQFTKPYNLTAGTGIYYIQLLYNCETLATEKIVISNK